MQHGPVIKTAVAAIAAVVALAAPHVAAIAMLDLWPALAWLVLGVAYTQFLEFWCHRVPMHRGVKLLGRVRLSHLKHHRRFHGANFQARSADDLQHIAGRYWVSPLIFVAHYALLRVLLPPAVVVMFLTGALIHYLAFEWTHWLTHIPGNRWDRALARIPVLSDIRARQIEHHRRHHETPDIAFNFNPPYLADRLSASMPGPRSTRAVVVRRPVAPSAPVVVRSRLRPLFRYGAAAIVGAAVVGGAAVAWKLWSGAHTEVTDTRA